MSAWLRGGGLVALVGVTACQTHAASQVAVARRPAVSAAVAQVPSRSATPQAPPALAPAPARISMKRRLVGQLACAAEVFAVEGRTFVGCGQELLVLEAGQLRSEPALARGLKLNVNSLGGRQLVSVAGRWPDSLWAATGEVSGGGNSHQLNFFRFRKHHWAKVGASVELGGAEGRVIFPWTADGLGALAARAFEPTRVITFSTKPAAVPRLAKAVQSPAEHEQYRCENMLIYPETWARLGPGDVMVFSGQLCGVPETREHERRLGVERLRVGQAAGEVTLLPVPDDAPANTHWTVVASAALSQTEVLVAASGTPLEPSPSMRTRGFMQLVRWDGAGWRTTPSPLQINGLWALGDRFAATDEQGALWLGHADQWTAVEFGSVEPSADAWSKGRITQLVAAEGAWWLVRQEELPQGVFSSRLYRLDLTTTPE